MTRHAFALLIVALLGCNKGSSEKQAAPAFALPKLGLSIGLTGKTAISDETYGNGYEIRNPAFGAGGALHVAMIQTPPSPDGQKEDREASGFTNVVMTKAPDGWTMTGERPDATMGGAFFVVSYHDVGGKHTECRSTGIVTAAAHQAAVAACASLSVTR